MVSMDVMGGGGLLDDAVGIGVGIASVVTGGVPAMIRCLDPTALGLVIFDFNPNEITMTRKNNASTSPNSSNKATASGGASSLLLQKANPPSISLKKITFTGETTKFRVDTLQAWCAPPAGLLTLAAKLLLGIPPNPKPPVVTFQWGPPLLGFMYSAILTNVAATYTRFHSSGIPVRAELQIDMQVQPSLLGSMPTNPTSGGLPGRTTHLVRSGETLHSIAHAHYKRPGLWRKIAEINGITDPTRVRPGTTVFLPNAAELTAGGSAGSR
jgi:nucleoid-associated protein YgaU